MSRAGYWLAAAVSVAVGASICAEKPAASPGNSFLIPISGDQKIIHVLNRLTFGPRPGDFDEVKRMGLGKWIDLQLHPEHISENPELAKKLAPLDTLRMQPIELARRYPPPQMVKAMMAGRMPYPSDPDQRMMVEALARRIKAREGKSGDGEHTLANLGLTDEQERILRSGPPEEKLKVFDGLLGEQQNEVLEAMPPAARASLFTVAPPELRRRIQKSGGPQAVITQDLSEAKLLRAIYGNRQLEEVLTDFWFNHFNVFLDKGFDRYLAGSYERDAIRPHVLGKFKDLLAATAGSPAMLFYLDNAQSVDPKAAERAKNMERFGRRARPGAQARRATGLNENYARELMELHTLGVDGGYTQHDVTEVARCFTGWGLRRPREGFGFEFHAQLHDNGPKEVLGVSISAGGGMGDGLKVLDILAHHPSTARFISKKLAMRFVADEPPPSLIDKMARTFTERDGDLRAVMETMLAAPEFWSQDAYRAKLKSPLEMVASAVRALGADIDFSFALNMQLAQLGEPLYRKQEPTGYANTGRDWMNSAALLARMNFAIALAGNRIPGVTVDAARFGGTADPDAIARDLMQIHLSEQARSAIEAGVKAQADPAAQATDADNAAEKGPGRGYMGMGRMGLLPPHPVPAPLVIAGLMLGSPDFQRR